MRGLLGEVPAKEGADNTASGEAPPAFRPEKRPRWRKVEPLVKSFLGNTVHLLGQLTDAKMTAFILRQAQACAPFLAPLERLSKRFVRAALRLFGEGEPQLRVQAVLLLRALLLSQPAAGAELVLKGAYRAFSANAKFVTAASLEHISFMGAGVAELFGAAQGVAYPLAFGYIRQLALLLRQALTAKSKEAFRAVYCWQAVNCMELWGRVLGAHASRPEDPLRPLVYPLSQIVSGAVLLLPTARYSPLRLRLLQLLQRLGAACGTYLPLGPLAADLLSFSELSKPPVVARGGSKPPDLAVSLKVGKADLRNPQVRAQRGPSLGRTVLHKTACTRPLPLGAALMGRRPSPGK